MSRISLLLFFLWLYVMLSRFDQMRTELTLPIKPYRPWWSGNTTSTVETRT